MKIIYVDDEKPARDNFRLTAASITEIESLEMFSDGEAAVSYAAENEVDAAFLDMEMPGLHGIALSLKLREANPNIRVVFVTAFSQYALDAFGVDAIGYVMKPYTVNDIRNELLKAANFRPLSAPRVTIETIPTFSVSVDGKPLYLGRSKPRELFALMVDRGEHGITTGEGIAYLWPERENDANTQSLLRMTYKRLTDALDEAGVGYIIASRDNHRFIKAEEVDCDLYRILSGDREAAKKYNGDYLQEYSWAEERNGQLYRMLLLNRY